MTISGKTPKNFAPGFRYEPLCCPAWYLDMGGNVAIALAVLLRGKKRPMLKVKSGRRHERAAGPGLNMGQSYGCVVRFSRRWGKVKWVDLLS